ncbi:MAG: maltose alpha-D-glucosyltransferase [Pseudomonadota bacterium]
MKKISSILASLVFVVVSGGDPPPALAGVPAPVSPAAAAAQDSPEYIQFLEQNSMLFQSDQVADRISGMGVQWREDFGVPEPLKLVQLASTWLLRYPASEITPESASVVRSWSDPAFWAAAGDIGIELMRTNPTQRAGGIRGTEFTPTIDGYFDRIGLDTAPEIGTDEEYRQMVANARQNGAVIGSDLVPLHSGLGPDFRLAQRAYKDYPGLYNMVQIAPEHWGLLPPVDDIWGMAHVSREAAAQLKELGYIPGNINSADADPQAETWSGWSATPAIVGVDGQTRRWVFLHVFKPAQPTYNWLDPSYAARRVNFGDLAHNLIDRGVPVVRLDADTFLGLEPQKDNDMASTYLTPLANVSTTDISMAARKLGGFTYQEFAAPLETLKQFAENGPDMSYDFFTRAEALYGLINGDALPLRLAHHFMLDAGVQSSTLVHDLQNHDEITFQLFELGSHGDFDFEGRQLNGQQLKGQILDTMRSTVGAAPYNRLYRPEQDGVATTFAGFIAPALGVTDPYNATPEQVETVRRGHLLVAHANAMIPGVFALSSWDLVGALPIPVESVPADLTAGGDWRWINRGGVDLMDASSKTTTAVRGLPEAKSLYGPLPQQLQDPNSFVSRLKAMLAAREQHRISEATMNAVPPVNDPGVAVLVMTLPDSQNLAVTALNYGRNATSVEVDLTQTPPGIPAATLAGVGTVDVISGQSAGAVSATGGLKIDLEGIAGRTIVVQRQPQAAQAN